MNDCDALLNLKDMVLTLLETCTDADLLDLIYKLLVSEAST
jgi:hypothetical protein